MNAPSLHRLKRLLQRAIFPPASELIHDARTNGIYLAIMLVMVGLPFLARIQPVAGDPLTFCGVPLPGMCMSRQWFGINCPGCGLTRSFVLIAHRRLAESWQMHRLGIPLYLFFAWQACFRAYCLLRRTRPIPQPFILIQRFIPAPLIALLLLNWLINILTAAPPV